MDDFSSLNAILISEITQTFLNFIPSFCNGDLNSEKCLHWDWDWDWVHVIWNNKDIRIDKKAIFYKNYYDSGIIYICDLQLHKSVKDLH